jgi:acetyl esterase
LAADYAPVLEQLAAAPKFSSLPVEHARQMWDLMDAGEAEEVGSVRDLKVSGAAGDLDARLYLPVSAADALVVFFHGGGWILGSLKSHDKPVRGLVKRTGLAFLAIDYRLAPEAPFPAGHDDAVSATIWAARNLSHLVGDGRKLIVGGDSAGANLAAAVAIALRDHEEVELAGQILIYPATDGRCETPSHTERAEGAMMTASDMRWFWNHYVSHSAQRVDPRASVGLAPDLSRLPPAIVATAEFDPLRDEGKAFTAALVKAGIPVLRLHFEDQPHGFMTFFQTVPSAGAAFDRLSFAIRQLAAE